VERIVQGTGDNAETRSYIGPPCTETGPSATNPRAWDLVRLWRQFLSCPLFLPFPTPKVTVWWFAVLLCIWEILCSNLKPKPSYPDYGLLQVSSVPPGKFWDSTLKTGHNHLLFNS